MLRNRRASHDYELLESFEAGIELTGSEVKSLRHGGGSIAEAYARVAGGQVFVEGMNIPIYEQASYNNHEPTRRRRLLLNASEIVEISRGLERRGLTLIPLRLYFKDGWAKLEVALARGKKVHDKRSDAAKKDAQREMDRELARGRRK
ncbi:MAG TPA: SsrA-binding protein SmpB [Trueperaceae bacterium]|nr:SsrA-binding protein SmpB [Trueperaceae bacterium]